MSDKIYFLDFEASSLSWDSYPIEIAWGNSLDTIKSYLISPENVDKWQEWNYAAEKIHGISRQTLKEKGEPPEKICDVVFNELNGKTVYTDNPCWDSMWLFKLYNDCGKEIPDIDIKHIEELLITIVSPPSIKGNVERLFNLLKLQTKARNIVKSRHRASVDVEYLINSYILAKKSID